MNVDSPSRRSSRPRGPLYRRLLQSEEPEMDAINRTAQTERFITTSEKDILLCNEEFVPSCPAAICW